MKRGQQLRAALVGAVLIAAAIPAITTWRASPSPTTSAPLRHAATVQPLTGSTVSSGSMPATVECAGISAPPPGPAYPIANQPWTAGFADQVINSVGAMDFPASYGGMKVTDDRDLVIYLAGQDPALVAEVDSLAGRAGMHVTYVGVPYSAGYLGALEECVAEELSDPEGRGVGDRGAVGRLGERGRRRHPGDAHQRAVVRPVRSVEPRPGCQRTSGPGCAVWRRPAGRAVADDTGSCRHLLTWRSLEGSLLQPAWRRECRHSGGATSPTTNSKGTDTHWLRK